MGGICFSVKKDNVIRMNKASIVNNNEPPNERNNQMPIEYKIKIIREQTQNNDLNSSVKEKSLNIHGLANSNVIRKSNNSFDLGNKNKLENNVDYTLQLYKSNNLAINSNNISINSNCHSSSNSSIKSTSKPINLQLENFIELSIIIDHKRKASKRKSKFQ